MAAHNPKSPVRSVAGKFGDVRITSEDIYDATPVNTPDTVVLRNGTGGFAAGDITAESLTVNGAASVKGLTIPTGYTFEMGSGGDKASITSNGYLNLPHVGGGLELSNWGMVVGGGSGRLDFYYGDLFYHGGSVYFGGAFTMQRTGDASSSVNQYDSGTIQFQPSIWTGTTSDLAYAWIKCVPNSGQNNKFRMQFSPYMLNYAGDPFCIQSKDWRTTTLSPNLGVNNSDPAAHFDIIEDDASRTVIKLKGASSQSGDYISVVDSSNAAKFTVDSSGYIKVGGTKVVGAQGAAVADATGSGDVVAQLNALLARLRAHGLIST